MAGLISSLNGLGGLPSGTKTLAEIFAESSRSEQSGLGGLGRSLLGSALADYSPLSPAPHPLADALRGFLPPTAPSHQSLLASALLKPQTKRKAYFAFRFQDIMRVNNVRQAWCIDHPNSSAMRSFYDRSIWEKSKSRDDETLKNLMRSGVEYSSAVCVLVGTNTWQSRWVKYEIARAVVDKRGLLTVHINGLNHIDRQAPDPNGYNPLHCMGVFHSPSGRYYLYENFVEVIPQTGQLVWAWRPYQDFKEAVPLPAYIPSVEQGYVMPLSRYTSEYDYVAGNGHRNIGAWIDCAAAGVGR